MRTSQARVNSGLRGAKDPLQNKNAKPSPTYKQKDPNSMVFRAKASNYVFIITNPQQTFDPVTGKQAFNAPIKKAKFQNYILETADDEIIGRLLESSSFGLGRDFWLLEDEQKILTVEAMKGVLTQLHSLTNIDSVPVELRQKLVKALGGDVKATFDPAQAGS